MSPLQKSYVYGTTIEKKYAYESSLKVTVNNTNSFKNV